MSGTGTMTVAAAIAAVTGAAVTRAYADAAAIAAVTGAYADASCYCAPCSALMLGRPVGGIEDNTHVHFQIHHWWFS